LIILLKYVFNCAIHWDVILPNTNPCQGVKKLEDSSIKERYLTSIEVNKLFSELKNNKNTQVCNIIRLLLYTGARKREILDAKWEEIDFKRRLLTIPAARSKSKKVRYIPLSDPAISLFQSISRSEDSPWVFCNPKTKKPPALTLEARKSLNLMVGRHGLEPWTKGL